MTCAACVNTIESYVKSQDGVEKVSVGLLAEKAEVYYKKSKINEEQIREAIEDVGYTAMILPDVCTPIFFKEISFFFFVTLNFSFFGGEKILEQIHIEKKCF